MQQFAEHSVSLWFHLLLCVKMPSTNAFLAVSAAVGCALAQRVPAAAQVVDQKIFNVLETVPPPAIANDSTVCHLHTSTIHIKRLRDTMI